VVKLGELKLSAAEIIFVSTETGLVLLASKLCFDCEMLANQEFAVKYVIFLDCSLCGSCGT